MATDLEKLISEFHEWQEVVNGKGRIPTHLKQQVIELCQRYDLETLEKCLGLKKAMMKQWHRRANIATKSALVTPIDFVTLPANKQTEPKHCAATLTLTMELSTGIKLLFSGQNITDLVELASHLALRLMA
jgi:hypothetical protein